MVLHRLPNHYGGIQNEMWDMVQLDNASVIEPLTQEVVCCVTNKTLFDFVFHKPKLRFCRPIIHKPTSEM